MKKRGGYSPGFWLLPRNLVIHLLELKKKSEDSPLTWKRNCSGTELATGLIFYPNQTPIEYGFGSIFASSMYGLSYLVHLIGQYLLRLIDLPLTYRRPVAEVSKVENLIFLAHFEFDFGCSPTSIDATLLGIKMFLLE